MTLKCKICKTKFERMHINELCCSDDCKRRNRARISALYQRKKWHTDPEWRKSRIAKNYQRVKARASRAKVSVRKLREKAYP